MEFRSPMAEGEDHLTVLPAELHVNIVEQLPVREMSHLRSLSPQFRDFIDTNQGLLTQNLVSHHRARINREFKLLTDLSDCDIVDALRRYDSHYGLVLDGKISMSCFRKVEAVSMTLDFHWIKSHRFLADSRSRPSPAWMQTYSTMSEPDITEEHIWQLGLVVDGCFHNRIWSHGFMDAEALQAKLTEVASTRVAATYAAIPSNFITRRMAGTMREEPFSFHQGLANDRETSELAQLLGLADLDSTEGSLAYCLRSGKTASLVHEMAQGRSSKLKQAAIIEEIFIW